MWVMVMCGLTAHSLADLMPLFWSEPVAISDSGTASAGLFTFMMTVTYLIPVCGILCTLVSVAQILLSRCEATVLKVG